MSRPELALTVQRISRREDSTELFLRQPLPFCAGQKMAAVVGSIGAALTVASAAIKLIKNVAEAVSWEERHTATRLAALMSNIGSSAADVQKYLKRVKKVRTREAKDELLSLALGKIEQMLLAIRDAIRLLTKLWSRRSRLVRIAQRLRKWGI